MLKILRKIRKRMKCEHQNYVDVHCVDTGLFMYQKCENCGKKKYLFN